MARLSSGPLKRAICTTNVGRVIYMTILIEMAVVTGGGTTLESSSWGRVFGISAET